jgi:hypothetical protein
MNRLDTLLAERQIRRMPGYLRIKAREALRELRNALREDAYEKMAKAPRTGWYQKGTHPARVGYYERRFSDGIFLQHWDGKVWHGSSRTTWNRSTIAGGGLPPPTKLPAWREVETTPISALMRAYGCL